MRLTDEQIEDGVRIPWGYGIAWYDSRRYECVLLPMPFNWIIGKLREATRFVVWRLHYPTPSKLQVWELKTRREIEAEVYTQLGITVKQYRALVKAQKEEG